MNVVGIRAAHTHMVRRLLAVVVALVAVVTLPVCLDASNAPMVDGDVLTITESRDVVQVMSEPGRYLLHAHDVAGGPDDCVTCGPRDQMPETPLVATADEQAQRAATLPSALLVRHTARVVAPVVLHEEAASLIAAPTSPPPRLAS